MNILIVSTFEGGYQPISALAATTSLVAEGFSPTLLDVYVDGVDEDKIKAANVIAVSMPLFDSLESGVQLIQQIKELNPSAILIAFGQYATLNPQRLSLNYVDFTIVGEWEKPIVSLANHLVLGKEFDLAGICTREMAELGSIPNPLITRKNIRTPLRSYAPPLAKYPQPQVEKLLERSAVVGGLETSRGCIHKCTYCSVFAAYDTKVVKVDEQYIIDDIEQMVAQGMDHLTFMDADFFNAKRRNVELIQTLHEKFPQLTFDFTTRVDFILDLEDLIPVLSECNVKFITSALEFPTQNVLDIVAKDITVEDIERAIEICNKANIKLNPTFIMYNPWIDKEELSQFQQFVIRNDLADIIDPIQYETRLKLYKGSPLLNRESTQPLELEEQEFHFDWKHPNPEIDNLYFSNLTPVEEGVFKRCCLKC